MQTITHAIIAAAGIGSRLGIDRPKCLLEINGFPLIYHQLKLLEEIPDVRIIVGFKEKELIDYILSIRSDVIFVRNNKYLTTSQNYSYWLAAKDLKEPYILMDADLYIEKESFNNFLKESQGDNLIGYTKAKTKDAIFVEVKNELIHQFSRVNKQPFEWCNIAYISNLKINPDGKFVYNEFEKYLPLRGKEIIVYEIDTHEDYEILEQNLNSLHAQTQLAGV